MSRLCCDNSFLVIFTSFSAAPLPCEKCGLLVICLKPYFATALITSRLDCGNYLLYNIASKDILKLQCVQNCLVRVVTRYPRFSHSVPLLKSLHWLHVQSRIIFKLCTIAYQILSSGEPSYRICPYSLESTL